MIVQDALSHTNRRLPHSWLTAIEQADVSSAPQLHGITVAGFSTTCTPSNPILTTLSTGSQSHLSDMETCYKAFRREVSGQRSR